MICNHFHIRLYVAIMCVQYFPYLNVWLYMYTWLQTGQASEEIAPARSLTRDTTKNKIKFSMHICNCLLHSGLWRRFAPSWMGYKARIWPRKYRTVLFNEFWPSIDKGNNSTSSLVLYFKFRDFNYIFMVKLYILIIGLTFISNSIIDNIISNSILTFGAKHINISSKFCL